MTLNCSSKCSANRLLARSATVFCTASEQASSLGWCRLLLSGPVSAEPLDPVHPGTALVEDGLMPNKAKARKKPRSVTAQDSAIGMLIRERRRALGMAQAELGKHLGVSFQQIQKYEKGTNRVSVRRLAIIAKVLGIPYHALLWPGRVRCRIA